MQAVVEGLRGFLGQPWVLWTWLGLNVVSAGVLWWDIRRNNPEIMSFMRLVWTLTVLYSGPIGLLIYRTTGRKQIPRDGVWRRGWRSVAHCYSGCGAGEITGLVIAVGLLALGTWWVAAITFALAYAFGYALTAAPLIQEGTPVRTALWDAFTSETASITVMEVVAIGTDLWLSGDAGMGDALFWTALMVSLSCGLLAAWPVNVWLIRKGVKEGMHDPREMAQHAQQH